MFQSGRGTDLLLSCLMEMSGIEDAFLSARTLRLEEVLAKLRPVLKVSSFSWQQPLCYCHSYVHDIKLQLEL